jgi:hypothetical protein
MTDTEMDDEWAAFAKRLEGVEEEPKLPLSDGSTAVPTAPDASSTFLHDLIAKLEESEAVIERHKERREALMDAIQKEIRFPPDAMNEATVFEFTSLTGVRRRVTVSRGERRSWDSKMLLAMADAGDDPAGVIDLSATIKKTTFDTLPPPAQDSYKPALTRKPGNLSIKIERI